MTKLTARKEMKSRFLPRRGAALLQGSIALVLLTFGSLFSSFAMTGAEANDWPDFAARAAKEYLRGHYTESEKLLLADIKEAEGRRENDIRKNIQDDIRIAATLNNLAKVYTVQGRYALAEPTYKRALMMFEKTVNRPGSPGVIRTLNNLAELYITQEQYASADVIYRRALEIKEKTLGSDHPNVVGDLNNLARLYVAQNQYTAAEVLYKRAVEIKKKALGDEHPSVATSLKDYAILVRLMKRETEATSLETSAENITAKLLQQARPDKLFTARSLDYPDHPLWPGLDATINEIQRDARSSLFRITQRKGIEGAGAMTRFFFCSVSSLAEQQNFGYWVNSDAVDDYAEMYILVAFLKTKGESVREVVGHQYDRYRFFEPGDVSLTREMCLSQR